MIFQYQWYWLSVDSLIQSAYFFPCFGFSNKINCDMAFNGALPRYKLEITYRLLSYNNTLWHCSKEILSPSFVCNILSVLLSLPQCLQEQALPKSVVIDLTLNMRGPSFLGLTRSISWLLMPWLLTSPEHQQPWYWLYRICRSFSYLGKGFKYMCQINVEEWHKMQIYVYIPSEKFST